MRFGEFEHIIAPFRRFTLSEEWVCQIGSTRFQPPARPFAKALVRKSNCMSTRDQSRDGFRNKLEYHLLSRYRPVWTVLQNFPRLERRTNALIINSLLKKTPPRPYPYSCASDFTSWTGLTDQSWYSRHLSYTHSADLPDIDSVLELFSDDQVGVTSSNSTALFPSFAQWFTDGFLLTDKNDGRRTFTSHQIDLNQVYGNTPNQTAALRVKSEASAKRGQLQIVERRGEIFAPALFLADGTRDPAFVALPEPEKFDYKASPDGVRSLFAFGGERANISPQVAMINTVFIREHNRLAHMLTQRNPDWSDDRVFETARLINIVLLIKIVVAEYINHISPYHFQLFADGSVANSAKWNRPNWIPVEFNVLYRWHSLVPPTLSWGGQTFPTHSLLLDNRLLLEHGLARSFEDICGQPARQMGLFNTVDFLLPVESATIRLARLNGLASYNDYRHIMSYPRVRKFEQISSNPKIVAGLKRVYKHVDKVEFYPGLLAEDHRPRSAVPSLLGRMVAIDAFSHALTNPVLAPNVFTKETFTQEGLNVITATSTLRDLVLRNTPKPDPTAHISMNIAAVDYVTPTPLAVR